MAIDKRISYDVQGGVKNYLGKQKEVKAPVKWQSSPDHPKTELAYITKAEKDLLIKKDLHGSLKGSVNRGPSGIISLNGYGSIEGGKDVGMSGSATSAAETVSGNARDVRDVQAQMNTANLGPSTMPQGAQDYRSEFIAAGGGQRVNPGFFDSRNVVSPQELALARAYDPAAFRASRRSGIMDFFTSGGLLGNIIRSIGQKFGLGKTYDQPTYDMSRYSNLPLGGSLTFENLDIRDKFDRRNTGIMQNIDPYKYSIGPQPVNLKTPQYFENVPYQEPDFYSDAVAELTNKQKRFIDSKKFPLQENLISPKSVYDTITNPDLGIYDDGIFGFGAQEPTTEEEYNDYLRSLGLTQTI
jgi:hypothetical protein